MSVEKKKTSYTVSKVLVGELEEMASLLGLKKSDMVSVSMAFTLARLAPLKQTPMKRHMLIRKVTEEFQNLLGEVVEGL